MVVLPDVSLRVLFCFSPAGRLTFKEQGRYKEDILHGRYKEDIPQARYKEDIVSEDVVSEVVRLYQCTVLQYRIYYCTVPPSYSIRRLPPQSLAVNSTSTSLQSFIMVPRPSFSLRDAQLNRLQSTSIPHDLITQPRVTELHLYSSLSYCHTVILSYCHIVKLLSLLHTCRYYHRPSPSAFVTPNSPRSSFVCAVLLIDTIPGQDFYHTRYKQKHSRSLFATFLQIAVLNEIIQDGGNRPVWGCCRDTTSECS